MTPFLVVKLNGGRHVQGILRGFDPFMNLVIDECVEMAPGGQQNNIGMVVSTGRGGGVVASQHSWLERDLMAPPVPPAALG